jgi:hypothetical protein
MARRRLSLDDRDGRFVTALAHHGVKKVEIARRLVRLPSIAALPISPGTDVV